MIKWTFFFCALCPCVFLLSAEVEEQLSKRVHAHLLIADRQSAVKEAEEALQHHPQSKDLRVAYIRALCEKGEEMAAMREWEKTFELIGQEAFHRNILQMLSWSVLNKGASSSQINVRMNALLGAALTKDVQALPLLLETLRSSNALFRSLAVKLSTSFPDVPIKEEIARLLVEEKVWYVRLEVIRAVGSLYLLELKPVLKEIISQQKTLVEEKAAALISLVSMYDAIDKEELFSLVHSDRAGLRQLASEVIAHLQLYDFIDLLLPLLTDPCSEVRISALNTLALLRVSKIGGVSVEELLLENLNFSAPDVAITAAYVLLLLNENQGSQYLAKWLYSDEEKWRRMASGALAVSGKYGTSLCLKGIKEIKDPYVSVNLARGLIGQRVEVNLASQAIYKALSQENQVLWMWDIEPNPLFRSLAPSRLKHIDQIPDYPKVVDQLTKLELLSILSIVSFPKAQEAVKKFLQTRSWGVTGVAAATLLQEGDEEGLKAVAELIRDSDQKIRVQAALILALVGSDPSVIPVLQDAYPLVDRAMKMHILEALAHIGDSQSIPFLLERLNEPFQVLRVVAASALIQCLYH